MKRRNRQRGSWRLVAVLAFVFAVFGTTGRAVAEELTGAEIYKERCAECHGPEGQGTELFYSEPLIGDRSIPGLARFISETMPEGAPEECTGEDARKVAAYIYQAFYSPQAQARRNPPEIAFSRLTVRQYENSVADLIASFTGRGERSEERGLDGDYFDSRRFRRRNLVLERRDPTIQFDFQDSSPHGERIAPKEFGIRWTGSLFAPETGEYEFILHSENGARLWVNDREDPLIDAWVRSGDETERRKSVRLLGGRVYPLKVQMFKSEQDDTASITLKWKPPHHAEEVIPERCLSPHRVPETFVLTTSFPPDDRNSGYERGTSISKAWYQATTYAAIEVARYVESRLDELADSPEDASDREQQLREFCRRFAERAFRRPLSEEQKQRYIDRQFQEAPNPEAAVKRVVLLVLKSPRFLYRELGRGDFDAYDVASWMSFGLWDSLPDQNLLNAAAAGKLQSRDQIAAQARRMLDDLRTRSKVRDFLHEWLKVDRFHGLSKDEKKFPKFSKAVASDLRTSLDLFLDEVVWGEDSDFRDLLLSDAIYLNGRLATFYGADLPEEAPFQKVSLQSDRRAGVLSHPYLMAGLAHRTTSSPIHRGVFLVRSVVGRFLKPPPEAVKPLDPDLHPDMTTRERVTLQTNSEACQRCHGMINPLGFSLEHFDAVGRYRKEEKGQPINATGWYTTRSGERVEFDGARELAEFLAGGEDVHNAFVQQLFQYTVKQPILAFGLDRREKLRRSFAENEFSIRHLLVEIITESALRIRESRQSAPKTADRSGG